MLKNGLLLLLTGLFTIPLTAQKQAPVWSVDFVRIKSGHRAEALYFYQNNWKLYRDTALARGNISAYRMLETRPDSLGNFDFLLMTAYPDSAAFQNSEKHFQPIINTLRFGGPYLLNQLKPSDFRENAFLKSCNTLFEAEQKQTQAVVHSTSDQAVLKELDRDIWIPFAQAYATGDVPQFLSIHSADFIRANGSSQEIKDLAMYGEGVRSGFQKGKDLQGRTQIEFRFFERFSNGVSASERGIYKYSFLQPESEPWVAYGKFQVISRKENGRWKILVDYDSNEGKTVNEVDFKAAKAAADW